MIEGQCPACRRVYKVDGRFAGMTGRCKACGAPIRVPGLLDEGLDGLPPVAPEGQDEPPQAPAAAPGNNPSAPGPASLGTDKAHPGDELVRPRDARARFEPSEGPTPLRGPWLKEQAELARAPAPGEAEAPAPSTPRAALAERFITPPAPEPAATEHRPALVRVAAVALGLLALAFAAHVGSAGGWGKAAAALGLALAALAVVRLWTARWDGLLAGLLLCLCVAGSALLPSEAPAAARILAVGSATVLLLLFVSLLRRSGREYFMT